MDGSARPAVLLIGNTAVTEDGLAHWSELTNVVTDSVQVKRR
jgi:hypothetical protein